MLFFFIWTSGERKYYISGRKNAQLYDINVFMFGQNFEIARKFLLCLILFSVGRHPKNEND